jgi:hypothetical protein
MSQLSRASVKRLCSTMLAASFATVAPVGECEKKCTSKIQKYTIKHGIFTCFVARLCAAAASLLRRDAVIYLLQRRPDAAQPWSFRYNGLLFEFEAFTRSEPIAIRPSDSARMEMEAYFCLPSDSARFSFYTRAIFLCKDAVTSCLHRSCLQISQERGRNNSSRFRLIPM